MNGELKVGDRVRHTHWVHQVGTVKWVGSVTCEVHWDGAPRSENHWHAEVDNQPSWVAPIEESESDCVW